MRTTFFPASIRGKLALAFAVLCTLLISVAALGMWTQHREATAFRHDVQEFQVRQTLAGEILDRANARAVATRNLMLASDARERDAEKARAVEAHAAVQSAHQRLAALIEGNPNVGSDERALYGRLQSVEARYRSVAEGIIAMSDAGRQADAVQQLNGVCRPLLAELVQASSDYGSWAQAASRRELESMEQLMASSAWILGGIATCGVVAALWLAVAMTRSITGPLDGALRVARTVAEGDLRSDIRTRSRDETGQLMDALRDMNGRLADIVSEVRQGSEIIGQGSAEIAAGGVDLSQRTERQAASLQQTAATMAQLSQTVRLNAENAQQADELARSASAVAGEGGAVVEQVVRTMKTIHDSSRRIADIIGVIDGIAFQTNILALNAAVEAARAGDQGRGFAVVAGEVRALAGRSAQAAREVRSLITGSVEQVEQGSQLADVAGRNMVRIVDSVRRVSDIVAGISSASSEQSRGVDLIGGAIRQMDEATQQNSALVEQSAAAADSLKAQASRLVESVSVFKLGARQAITA